MLSTGGGIAADPERLNVWQDDICLWTVLPVAVTLRSAPLYVVCSQDYPRYVVLSSRLPRVKVYILHHAA